MLITDTAVSFLEESILQSGFPMTTGNPSDFNTQVKNLKTWLNNKDFKTIVDIVEYRTKSVQDTSYFINSCRLSVIDNCAVIKVDSDLGTSSEILVEYEVVPLLKKYALFEERGVIVAKSLIKTVFLCELLNSLYGEVVHLNGKPDFIGSNALDYRVSNLRVSDFYKSRIRSGSLAVAYTHYKRMRSLASTKPSSGHDNALKGIIVGFNLKYPQYISPQLQRYHWVDIVSSQSKMHKLTSIKDISSSCNKHVLPIIIETINDLISKYNTYDTISLDYFEKYGIKVSSKAELFQHIISSLPLGYEMWMGVRTNYLQLKTIYHQRKNHKLYDWKYFCEWAESLPMSELITSK